MAEVTSVSPGSGEYPKSLKVTGPEWTADPMAARRERWGLRRITGLKRNRPAPRQTGRGHFNLKCHLNLRL